MAAEARRQDAAARTGMMPSGRRQPPAPLAARCRPRSGGDALDSAMGEGEAGGAANAASRGAARGRGARRCRMRRRAPFTLMSPPQRTASRASRCSVEREGRMPDLLLAVFAARRKPIPARWSRAARTGGHSSSRLARWGATPKRLRHSISNWHPQQATELVFESREQRLDLALHLGRDPSPSLHHVVIRFLGDLDLKHE